jgi:hypothetical protein
VAAEPLHALATRGWAAARVAPVALETMRNLRLLVLAFGVAVGSFYPFIAVILVSIPAAFVVFTFVVGFAFSLGH